MKSAACEEPTSTGVLLTPAWRQAAVALVLLIGWILFLYRDTGIAMVAIWTRSETFTHAFLVAPISMWLIWRQRNILLAQVPGPNLWVLLGVLFVAFGWLLGDLVAVNAVTQLAMVALLVLTVPAVLGMAIARLIFFPLGFLFFCGAHWRISFASTHGVDGRLHGAGPSSERHSRLQGRSAVYYSVRQLVGGRGV